MGTNTVTFEIEDVGTWKIPMAVATTIEELAGERIRFLARAEAAELELSQERFMRQAAEADELREQVAALRRVWSSALDKLTTAEAECKRLREQVAGLTALWQQAIDADLLDDPHELEAAIVKAGRMLNYPRTLDGDA